LPGFVAGAPITGGAEVSGQVQMLADVPSQAAWVGLFSGASLFFLALLAGQD